MTQRDRPVAVHKGTQTVGDVEVSTTILVPVPEHDKLRKVATESQSCGAFLDWLTGERGLILCEMCEMESENDRFYPAQVRIQSLLAEYFEIDERKLEDEKLAMLEAIRR